MPAETDAVPALEARGLTFSYGENADPVFSDLSLTVGRGEVVLVMGASGCGKSTLALCLAGLYPAYAGVASGAVLAAGRPVAEMGPRERSREVSILFQNPDNQFCMDTVEREVLFALENVGWEGDMRARCRELLALVGLEERAGERIGRLSGGTKQKLALCTALAAWCSCAPPAASTRLRLRQRTSWPTRGGCVPPGCSWTSSGRRATPRCRWPQTPARSCAPVDCPWATAADGPSRACLRAWTSTLPAVASAR